MNLSFTTESFSEFGLHYMKHFFSLIIPEGSSMISNWMLMKWWHVALISCCYPFLLGNLRVYRFENHPKPINNITLVALLVTAFSVVVYMFILYEIILYFAHEEHPLACHPIERDTDRGMRMASVLWFFHLARLFFDLVNILQSTLTKSISDLRSEQSINEIRFTLTHFLVWWMTLLYYPGGEVLYPVAVVCLFHLGTIACAFSQGKFIKLKMFLWILLVISNFIRLFINLWNGCPLPASILMISPPYDINSNVHMIMFFFLSYVPIGSIFHYLLFGRGTLCTWWTVLIFLICAHWPRYSLPLSSSKSGKSISIITVNNSANSIISGNSNNGGYKINNIITPSSHKKESRKENERETA